MAPTLPEDGYLEDGAEHMPAVSFADARRIMTRTDFLEPLDAFQVGSMFSLDVADDRSLRLT